MSDKFKRHSATHPNLARLARILIWVGWIGLIVAFVYAFQRFGSEQGIAWSSGPETRSFHHMVWNPFVTALAFFVVGALPSGLTMLIGRLTAWGLRLEDENLAQQEFIHTLMRKRDEDAGQQLEEEGEGDEEDSEDELIYHQLYRRR